jgi:hypothetical protein
MSARHRNPRATVAGFGIDERPGDWTFTEAAQPVPERSEDEGTAAEDEENDDEDGEDGDDIDEVDEEGEDEDEALEQR